VDCPHPAVFLSTCLPDHPPAEKTETKVQHDYPETPAANLLRFKSESDDSGCSSLSLSHNALHLMSVYTPALFIDLHTCED